jgi:subtilase family serine protease
LYLFRVADSHGLLRRDGGSITRGGVVTRATVLSQRDVVVGPLSLTESLHVVIALKLRNQAQLHALIAIPGGAFTPLTPVQFRAQFSPTQAQAQQVATFLANAGFTNVTIAPNRLLVSGDASVAIIQAAFKTSMVDVHTHDGREAYANSTDVQIPTALQSSVQTVLGLQNLYTMHTFSNPVQPNVVPENPCYPSQNAIAASDSASPQVVSCKYTHSPTEFPSIYQATGLPTAASVPVGIFTWGNLTQVIQDLNEFTSTHNLLAVDIQVVGPGSSDTSGIGEWDLDSQTIIGMTGGVQKLVFYDAAGSTDADLYSIYNTAVSADAVKVINGSFGGCETFPGQDGYAAADDNVFAEAVAQGMTLSFSSGDTGATGYECPAGSLIPNWPASSQYVVSVGGTSLRSPQYAPYQWAGETVWNGYSDGCSNGATGGSPSTLEPMPSWQQNVGQNAGHNTRGVADIAFDADPCTGSNIIVDGQTYTYGGTSLASPLFVGAWARILAFKAGPIGFAAPLLYGLQARDFHDVTLGNNNGETAAPGWDYTTGFGSLIVTQAAYDLPIHQGPPDNPPIPPG